MEIEERNIISNDWMTVVILCIFLFIAFSKLIFPQRFDDFAKILSSKRLFDSHTNLKQIDYFSLLLFVVNILSVSLLIFIFWKHFSPGEIVRPKLLFFQIALSYWMFFTLKYFLEKIIGDIFQIDKILDRYIWYKIVFRNFLAIGLLAPSLFFIYGPNPSTTEIVIVACAVGAFNIAMLGNFYRKNRKYILPHAFYFILYLCALEIAPYLVLYQVIGT